MSIDFLNELERMVSNGSEIFACPGVQPKSYLISKTLEDVVRHAQRVANSRKQPVYVMKLVPKADVMPGENYLVPVGIDAAGPRGEPNIRWSTVESKEAAEMMRDVREGPSPYFGMQEWEEIQPKIKESA